MYKNFYHLKEEPFNITPDPRFLYVTPHHRDALNHLLYGILERKGFICLTGEIGAGKTTLCRALLNELGPSCRTALILNPSLTPQQLLRSVVDEFGLPAKRMDRLGYLKLLNQYLLLINASGHNAVLIIDEAQDMPPETMELTRLLSNLETERHKLLQIILVGQPELRQRLAHPSLRQLAQRITVWFHLQNMTEQDTEQYIRHRIDVASAEGCGEQNIRFDRGAIREIYRRTGGTPRLVNSVGDKALLAGFVHGAASINKRLVRLAAAELKESCR